MNAMPGDLLACSGKGVISDLIRTVSPRFSHVALVVGWSPSVVAESTASSNLPDMESGLLTIGVQAHFFSDWLAAYDGDVWQYSLKEPLIGSQEVQLVKWIETEHRYNVGYNFAGVMKLGWDRLRPHTALDLSPLFCSELVTAAYEAIGIVSGKVPADQTPDDVVNFNLYQAPVKLK